MSQPRSVLDYLNLAADFLAQKDIDSARLDAEVLLGYVLDKDRVFLYVHFDQPLEPAEVDAYRSLIARRAKREPVAYLTGKREFFSLPFRVTPSVLIPRPETEYLIEWVLAWAGDRGGLEIVDVGTGSGAIALTLAHELRDAHLVAIDTSPEALQVAKENAAALEVAGRVRFEQGEWLNPMLGAQVDAVVSNPPYIEAAAIRELEPEVSKHEPRLALDGGADGLAAYRMIIPQAAKVVRPEGVLVLEIGVGQAEAVTSIGQAAGWELEEIVADQAGIDRVVCLRRGAV